LRRPAFHLEQPVRDLFGAAGEARVLAEPLDQPLS
jgi:hypothetical protein